MKRVVAAICMIVLSVCFVACSPEAVVPEGETVKIELDYAGFTPNVYRGATVTLPTAFVENDAEATANIAVEVQREGGGVLTPSGGTVTPTELGKYDVTYRVGNGKKTESFFVLEEGVIDGAEYAGQEKVWSTRDGDGNCELERNTDEAYLVEGTASYKMLIDGKNSGGYPGMKLTAENMAGANGGAEIPVRDFSDYDELRFAFYNDTDAIAQLGMKFYSDDGISQSVDSLVNAYGVQPREWVWVSVSMRAFHAYSSTFSPENITQMKIFIKNQTNTYKKFYFDDFRLLRYNDPKTDYASLKTGENVTFDCFNLENGSYERTTLNVTETLVTGFENKADAIKIEPYRNGSSKYAEYASLDAAVRRTDSGAGLMYYLSGGDVWSMTFETMRKPNRKLSMLLFDDPDFSGYDFIAVDVYNPSSVSGIFSLGLASETEGYVAYQEQTTIAAASWGTIYLKIANARDSLSGTNTTGVDVQNVMDVNIGTNPTIVTTGFYIDNLRFINVNA